LAFPIFLFFYHNNFKPVFKSHFLSLFSFTLQRSQISKSCKSKSASIIFALSWSSLNPPFKIVIYGIYSLMISLTSFKANSDSFTFSTQFVECVIWIFLYFFGDYDLDLLRLFFLLPYFLLGGFIKGWNGKEVIKQI